VDGNQASNRPGLCPTVDLRPTVCQLWFAMVALPRGANTLSGAACHASLLRPRGIRQVPLSESAQTESTGCAESREPPRRTRLPWCVLLREFPLVPDCRLSVPSRALIQEAGGWRRSGFDTDFGSPKRRSDLSNAWAASPQQMGIGLWPVYPAFFVLSLLTSS
jgi:hypothetical protein